jgi:NAD(P)-dependent dehydrogenase (short-subunit alcohol dehydrogenase family)
VSSSSGSGRVALVTGGTAGIGRAVVERLLADGVRVLVVARDKQRLKELATSNSLVATIAGDVAKPGTAEQAVAACIDAFGALDALINNAGGSQLQSWDASDDQWYDMFSLNLLSAVRMCRAAVPYLAARPNPRIVNVGTELVFMPNDEFVPYTAAKMGLISFTKSLSCALAHQHILVNAVCPGTIETPLARLSIERMGEEWGLDYGEALTHFVRDVRGIKLGRLGRPDEVADAIAYLASPGCSYTTGAVLRCDGGSTSNPL